MKIEFKDQPLSKLSVDAEVVFVIGKNENHHFVTDTKELKKMGFLDGESDVCFAQSSDKLYVKCESLDADEIRCAAAKAVNYFRGKKFATLKIASYLDGGCEGRMIKALCEGFLLGSYSYEEYKSKKNPCQIKSITISSETYDEKIKKADEAAMQKALVDAKAVCDAVCLARDIVNSCPDEMIPSNVAREAKKIAMENSLDCVIHDEKYLKEQKMGAFLAVSRASAHPPRLIHLTYKPKNPKAKIILIGKGLTYDSGGLSLKPADYMVTMKSDKSGASAVLAIMSALPKLGLDIEVHGIAGVCENMIGGNAYKPDDVLVAKNGKTIEVRNTDAEGRLVLADCFCYAQDYAKEQGWQPDAIMDFATLTGACVVALGEYTSGIMGHNKQLKDDVLHAAERAGELAAELPFNKYLKKLLKSEVADISNVSSARYGGAITAALFLSEFITDENRERWVHMDIAGPAYVEKAWGYNPHGASGAGVRTAIKWLAGFSQKQCSPACAPSESKPKKKK